MNRYELAIVNRDLMINAQKQAFSGRGQHDKHDKHIFNCGTPREVIMWIKNTFLTSCEASKQIRGFVYACDYYCEKKNPLILKAVLDSFRNNPNSLNRVKEIFASCGIVEIAGELDTTEFSAVIMKLYVNDIVVNCFTSWANGYHSIKLESNRPLPEMIEHK